MTEEVKLLGMKISPMSCRVEIGLKLKGVEYEFIEENLKDKSPLLLKSNPVYKKIPVLLHKGKPISESLVILEYIDEAWINNGSSILPDDPYEKAKARFWAKFIDDKCVTSLKTALFGKGEEQEKAIEEAQQVFSMLENELEGKKFFGGNTIGLPDIAANRIALWLGVYEEIKEIKLLAKEKYPNLSGWIDEFLSVDVVKETLPPRDNVLSYLKARIG